MTIPNKGRGLPPKQLPPLGVSPECLAKAWFTLKPSQQGKKA